MFQNNGQGMEFRVQQSGAHYMANNYSSDPKQMLPVNDAATPQSGSVGNAPGMLSTPPARSVSSSFPNGGSSVVMPSSSSAPDNENAGSPRRLSPGTVLSSDRYRIGRLAASGGMGAVYRVIDTRFDRPCPVKEMLDEFFFLMIRRPPRSTLFPYTTL